MAIDVGGEFHKNVGKYLPKLFDLTEDFWAFKKKTEQAEYMNSRNNDSSGGMGGKIDSSTLGVLRHNLHDL